MPDPLPLAADAPGAGLAAGGPRLLAAGAPLDEAGLAAAYAYPDDPPNGRWLRANMVSTLDGAAAAGDGITRGISGDADRRLFAMLRALSDVVLVGAGTVRTEGYGPVRIRAAHAALRRGAVGPPVPPIAVVTASLDLDLGAPLFTKAATPTIVLTAASAPAERLAAARKVTDVLVAGTDRVDLTAALAALAGRGYRRMLCEGGPRLLAELAAGGLLDELCLALSPALAGGAADRILVGPALAQPDGPDAGPPMRLAHSHAEDGFLFLRYLAARP